MDVGGAGDSVGASVGESGRENSVGEGGGVGRSGRHMIDRPWTAEDAAVSKKSLTFFRRGV